MNQYPGEHWTSCGLILKSCHRLLLFVFYWPENFKSNLEFFPKLRGGQVCVRGVVGGRQMPYQNLRQQQLFVPCFQNFE